MKIGYWVIGLLGYWVIFVSTASADSLSLSVNPSIIEVNAISPTTATSKLSIQNKSDTPVTLQIQLKPFRPKGENGELEYSKETPEIFKNIQILDEGVPVKSIILGPMQQKSLNLNINIPAGGRDYYFSVVFIQHLQDSTEKGAGFISTSSSPIESSSSINQVGIAANVLLSVGPLEIPKAVLEEFSSNIFFEKGPIPFTIRIKNEGAHFIKPKGEIIIKNIFGQSIGKLDLLSVNVLSDSIRAIPNKNSAAFKRPTALWKENFLLGLYTATLNISMSDEGPIFTRTAYFFAFPFQALIIIVIIVIAVIIINNRLKLYMTHR